MIDDAFVIEDGVLEEYLGEDDEVIVPEGVAEISDYAFSSNEALSAITIPSSVKQIGTAAFDGCYSLGAIYIASPNQLLLFGASESGENPLNGACKLYLNGQLVTDLVVSDDAMYIPDGAFNGYDALTSVTIGNSVTNIGNYAFADCRNLTDVTISDSVNAISAYAFYSCGNLRNLTIGKGLKRVERSAFEFCDNIKNVYYNGDIAAWCSINFDDFANPLRSCADFYVKGASGSYELLTELVIPAGITTIGYQVLKGVQSLSKLTVGNDVKQICTEAFAWGSFSSVVIGDSVELIGMGAFVGCNDLHSVVLGNGVKNIGNGAFDDCFEFTTIYYNGTAAEFENIKMDEDFKEQIRREDIKVYYYSENAPTTAGNFWHYVDNTPTAWQ